MKRLPGRVAQGVDDRTLGAFQRDGAVVVRQFLNNQELALLELGIERNLAQPSARAKVASRSDDPGRFFEDFCNWQRIDAYRRLIHKSPLALLGQ